MKKIYFILFSILISFSGCTRIHYQGVSYSSFLNDKQFGEMEIELDPETRKVKVLIKQYESETSQVLRTFVEEATKAGILIP